MGPEAHRPTDHPSDEKDAAVDMYAVPENFLEIEIINPLTHGLGKDRFTDYEIRCTTNLPVFKFKASSVRRRYREFAWLRDLLSRENPRIPIPAIPGKHIMADRFSPLFVEDRRRGLEAFIQQYVLVVTLVVLADGRLTRSLALLSIRRC